MILEAGFGSDSAGWEPFQRELAQLTRVCRYDRAGLGQSPAPESARTAADQADELAATLDAAGIAPPYVVDGVLIYVEDVDAHCERARAGGARILSEPEDNPYAGQRQYRAEDPEGHRWMVAQPL